MSYNSRIAPGQCIIRKVVRMSEGIDPILHQRHDLFNLITLPVIIFYLFLFITSYRLNSETPFAETCLVGEIYFIVDTIWLILFPRSVSSPYLIIAHHLVAALGYYTPMWDSSLAGYVSACFLVEVNTFCLIGKRSFSDMRLIRISLTVGFHVTWIALRVVMYPILLYSFTLESVGRVRSADSSSNVHILGWILLLFLTILNMKWTYDLYFRRHPATDRKGL